MRRFVRVIAILLAAVLLFGCTAREDQSGAIQSASGGNASAAEHINLKDINITAGADETVVTLSLLSGSRGSIYPESKLLSLPEYSVVQLTSPYRIMITLQNVSFWDYEQKGSWTFNDFLLGMFQEVPAANDSLVIYLQISRTAQFTVEESEGDLIIRLRSDTADTGARYYCISNAFYEHQEGTWPQDIDMTPVLCSDLQNKLLISQPFDTMEEAESYRDTVGAQLQTALPGKSLSVIELDAGALPDFTDIDFSAAENQSVVMKDGTAAITPLLLQNGRYLATAPDGRIAFSRRYRPEEPALEQDAYLSSEKLWILDLSGRVQSVDIPEFYMIDAAQFSFDSRYICLLDVSIENSVLYVYDFDKATLRNLGEEGFGNQTVAFSWSDTDNTLYAMTGDDETLQMLSCTFADDGIDIRAVEEQPGAVGHIGVSQGRLYFADSYAGVIYEVGETRIELTAGFDFQISPDGSAMAVLETSVVDSEEVLTNLKLYDIVTGECRVITESADIAAYGFSANGDDVYYTVEGAGAAEGYNYELYSYDAISGESTRLALCSTGDIAVGKEDTIYLIQYFNDAENSYYATYQYSLGQ